ncbi:MAG: 2-oxoacid:acceptor oxidoreductase subunit alpha [Chloroflexota bacterium]
MAQNIVYLDEVTIRFAGDSGDGMQITGTQFSNTSGSIGNDVNTFPDYPSEIRAPEGTLYGVSAYQIHFGSKQITTMGDKIDCLVAMNASSLKVSLPNVREGGIIIANTAGFGAKNLALAKYESNPLEDDSLSKYRVIKLDITKVISDELADLKLSPKAVHRTKNFFALGVAYWIYSRPIEPTMNWLVDKFGKKPEILAANQRALKAGYDFAASREELNVQYVVRPAKLEKGFYRNITGNNAVALGLVAASQKCGLPLFLGSYPITPATEILHHLSGYKRYGVKHLQAEDEIAGVCSAIGASYGGYLSVTTTSGPGLSLKVEAMGLAVILELPLIIVDVQRAGPSTGLPTKPEQSDLFIAVYGRHGEAPMPVICARSASHCFDMTIEAARIALKYMTPVILLTDGYLAQGSEPWKIPTLEELPEMKVNFATDPATFKSYKRDPETLARMWAIPGTPELEHRIGGLEKEDGSGAVSMDPANHQKMVELRAAKIAGIANDIPLAEIEGEQEGDLLVIGWGSSYGAIKTAFDVLKAEGKKFGYTHLNYINPLPRNIGEIISKFKRVLVPELNMGQLATLLRSTFLINPIQLNKVQGSPFKAAEIEAKIRELLSEESK